MTLVEEHYKWMLDARDIETPCMKCQGMGSRAYGSTATWHGGMGGASITSDVCDHCWGSGDEHRHWTDLRRLKSGEDHRVHLRAGELLAHRCGVGLRTLLPGLDELVLELRKFERQRRPRTYGFGTVAHCLANLLGDLITAKKSELASPSPSEGDDHG